MATRKGLPQLTPAELEVMKVLWGEEGLSAREVHQRLADRTNWAYSTTRTTVERMVRKDLVAKNDFHGLHIYSASVSRVTGLARMVRDFTQQVLETSHVPVVSLFADSGALSEDEVEELKQLLDRSDREKD